MSRLRCIVYNEGNCWGLDEVGDDELARCQDESRTVQDEACPWLGISFVTSSLEPCSHSGCDPGLLLFEQ